jgi:diacylglycerol kinase (ATP)
MKIRNLIDSFNYAISGLIYALKTQRNMKIHFIIGSIVIITSLFMDFSRIELIILFFTICLVIITEMINTAIEATVDLYTKTYHPLARIAKNVAAGTVLIASVNSIIVAYVLFFNRINPVAKNILHRVQQSPGHLTFVSLVLVIVVVIAVKSKFSVGSYMVGGMPSGHSAISFSISTAIALISEDVLVASMAFLLAFLISQSRIEGRIHTPFEVIVGGIIGTLITILIFQLY